MGNRPASSRGSTATGASPASADQSSASPASLQAYSEAQAWLQQGEYLVRHGQYLPAKVFSADPIISACIHFVRTALYLCLNTVSLG